MSGWLFLKAISFQSQLILGDHFAVKTEAPLVTLLDCIEGKLLGFFFGMFLFFLLS